MSFIISITYVDFILMNRIILFFVFCFTLLWPPVFGQNQKNERKAFFPKEEIPFKDFPDQENVWVFLMAGQSNMAGRGWVEPRDTIPDARIITINQNHEWILAKEPLHFYQPKLTGLDCGLSFARELKKKIPRDVVIVLLPCAVGGSPVDVWLNDSVFNGVRLKSNFKEKVNLGKEVGVIKGILWHQGESDAFAQKIPGYYKKLNTLFSFFRDYIGNDELTIVLGELGRFAATKEMKKNWAAINDIIGQVARENDRNYLVKSNGLKSKDDNIHFNANSIRKLGKRYAQVYLKCAIKLK